MAKKPRLYISAFITFFILVAASPLFADEQQEPIGRVIAIRGQVTAINSEEISRTLSLKSPIYQKDTLKTGKQGRIQVMFTDNTIISLGRKSVMIISEYEWKPGQKKGALKTKVKEGVFRVMGGTITKVAPKKFTTETPAATIGIRGSMYAGRVSGNTLSVVFLGGKGIEVTNDAGSVAITIPGYGTHVMGASEAPLPPVKFDAEDIAELNKDLSGNGEATGAEESGEGADPGENADTVETDPADDGKGSDDPDSDAPDESEVKEENDFPTDTDDQSIPDDVTQPPSGEDPKDIPGEKETPLLAVKYPNPEGDNVSSDTGGGLLPGREQDFQSQPPLNEDPMAGTDTVYQSPDSGEEMPLVAKGGFGSSSADTELTAGEAPLSPMDDLGSMDMNTGDTGFAQFDYENPIGDFNDTIADFSDVIDNNLQDDIDIYASGDVVYSASVTDEGDSTTTTTTITTTTTTTTTYTTFDTTTTTVPATPTVANLTGKFLSIQVDTDTGTNTGDAVWSGSSSADSTDGSVSGTATAGQDSKTFSIAFSIATYDDTATYTGHTHATLDRDVNLNSSDWTFTNGLDISSADLGEFAIYYLAPTIFDGSSYKYQEIGFIGIASSSVPTDGVQAYAGDVLSALDETSTYEVSTGTLDMATNWHNGKVLGRVDTASSNTYVFFGDVSGTGLNNIQFVGSRGVTGSPDAVDGASTFGQFYGSVQQGFGMTAAGTDVDVYSQANLNSWEMVATGFREYEVTPLNPNSPTGSTQFEGFFFGYAEDMDNPSVNRRLFMNAGSANFFLTVDKDAGTLSGNLSGDDILSSYQINNIVVGGANGSAYILDDNFAAALGDGGGTPVTDGTNSGGLKTYGNYMISMPPADQVSNLYTWGYWEAAYVDPTSGAEYHIHQPGSVWIAGERTPAAYVQSLIDTATFVGNYAGFAKGIEIDNGGTVTELTGGSTNLTIDFSKVTVADAVTGSIGFTGSGGAVSLTVGSNASTLTSSGFSAHFTDGTVNASSINGIFFGPTADAVGGNFEADMVAGERYLGIFGGDR